MIETVIAALFGLLIGSFLNVCIYRWPRDLSVVRPRSACPECEKPIAWFDNIPLLSFAILRGHCRLCRTDIPWRYPLVELTTAISFAYFVHHNGANLQAAKYCIFAAIVIGLTFSDLETLLLPDELTLGGLAIGLGFALFVHVPDTTFQVMASLAGFYPGRLAGMFLEALAGAIIPAGAIWLGGWIFEKVRHKEGLGFGDVKMLAMIGAFLGLQGTLLTVIAGSLVGSVVGYAFIKIKGEDASTYPLPYGSFLGAAALFAAVRIQYIKF